MQWRAVYDDGTLYRSEETAWTALPASGVVAVAVLRDTGRTRYASGDWYWLADGAMHYISATSWGGTWEPKPNLSCRSCVKRGVAVPDAQYAAACRLVLEV